MNLLLLLIITSTTPTLALGYEVHLLNPIADAETYEFAIYPNGEEKIITNPGPFVDSNDLPVGKYLYNRRIKKHGEWTPWSHTKVMTVSTYLEKYKTLRVDEIKTETKEELKFVLENKTEQKIKTKEEVKPQEVLSSSKIKDWRIAPFAFAVSRSFDAKNVDVAKTASEGALRFGADLTYKSYFAELLYETGSTYKRADISTFKTIGSKFDLGLRFMQIAANFNDGTNNAEINNSHAFLQARGNHSLENGVKFSLSGGGTLQGSIIGALAASKSWLLKENYKLTPSLGYEYLDVKGDGTSLKSSNYLAGLFFEIGL